MNNTDSNQNKPTLWILRIHAFLFKSKRYSQKSIFSFASSLIMSLPFWISGILISYQIHYHIFSWGVVSGSIWLSIAPFLMRTNHDYIGSSLDKISSLFTENRLNVEEELKKIQSNWNLIFGIPLGIIAVYLLNDTVYSQAPNIIRVWVSVTFAYLLILAGIGFWGVVATGILIKQLLTRTLKVDIFHPDKLGGLRTLNNMHFFVVASFYSGSLLFFIAFEIMRNSLQIYAQYLLLGTVLLFILIGITTYLIINYQIKKTIRQKRDFDILKSEEKLQEMIEKNLLFPDRHGGYRNLIQTYLYFVIFHKRLLESRFNLIDKEFILKVLPASLSPLIVVIKELYFG